MFVTFTGGAGDICPRTGVIAPAIVDVQNGLVAVTEDEVYEDEHENPKCV
jgi:hypothetical protein